MEKFTQLKERAIRAGCGPKIETLHQFMHDIAAGATMNIAILGGANSGKTSLINQLAGTVVRKPSFISKNEKPLLVTFVHSVSKEGFETKILNDPVRQELGVSLYEIPIALALNVDSATPTVLLESMDFVIYMVSALSPLNAEDIRNLSALANRIPFALMVSKLSMLPDEGERAQLLEDVSQRFRERFGSGTILTMEPEAEQTLADFRELLAEYPLAQLREAHAALLMAKGNQIVRHALASRLSALKAKQQLVSEDSLGPEAGEKAQKAREQQQMLEALVDEVAQKQQEMRKRLMAIANSERKSLESRLMLEFSNAGMTEDWCLENAPKRMREEMEKLAEQALEQLTQTLTELVTKSISEVESKFSVKLEIEDQVLEKLFTYRDGLQMPEKRPNTGGKVTLAICSGLIAVAALMLSLTTKNQILWLFAVPSLVTALVLLKMVQDERRKYREALRLSLAQYVNRCFSNLLGNIGNAVMRHYQLIIDDLQNFAHNLDPQGSDMSEIRREEKSILEQMKACDTLYN